MKKLKAHKKNVKSNIRKDTKQELSTFLKLGRTSPFILSFFCYNNLHYHNKGYQMKFYNREKELELLSSGNYTVSEVASKVGYKFANNFTNAFIKKFGTNPKEFKKLHYINL